jgi:hypothetical protein
MLASATSQEARMSYKIDRMFRAFATLCFAVIALAAVLPTAPSFAQETIAYVSANGGGSTCTAAAPCATMDAAFSALPSAGGGIECLDGNASNDGGFGFNAGFTSYFLDIDCPRGVVGALTLNNLASSSKVILRHLTFRSGSTELSFFSGGTLILEDCTFIGSSNVALDIEPNSALNLVIRNSRISNNGSGILLKPSSDSVHATLDHVVITGNTGGGIRADSTHGTVNMDITDSEISNNAGNGINVIGSANQNMLNLSRSVIAKNGAAGLQVNGATAAALVDMSLFDTNATGATSIAGGAHLGSYNNNRIVGSAGSGFSNMVGLQ